MPDRGARGRFKAQLGVEKAGHSCWGDAEEADQGAYSPSPAGRGGHAAPRTETGNRLLRLQGVMAGKIEAALPPRTFGIPLRFALCEGRSTVEERQWVRALFPALFGGGFVDLEAERVEGYAIIL
jgi:hypothetical protein